MKTKLKRLVAVCRLCGATLTVNEQTGKLTCPKHGAQERYSYAAGGKDD